MIQQKKYLSIICIIINFVHLSAAPRHAITYNLLPTRFGDHLLTYTKARWISYEFNIPLLYKPFTYSDKLVLHQKETLFSSKRAKGFERIHHILTEKKLVVKNNNPTLFVCDLKFSAHNLKGFNDLYRYTITNTAFKQELLNMIQPMEPIEPLVLPKDKITVAVHVRRGGGFDKPLLNVNTTYSKKKNNTKPKFYADKIYPRRFPPDNYYIEQIKRISTMFNDAPMHVHIFTDDQHPQHIADTFKQQLNNSNITFSYRTAGNKHNKNVLEDFFAMTQFDCLIRPASSFSKMVQLLGNHKIIIYPKDATWIGNRLIVNKIGMIKREDAELNYYSFLP